MSWSELRSTPCGQRHDPDLFKSVGAYLPAGDEWGDLELALASLDVDNIISDLEHFMPSYGADDSDSSAISQ